MILNYCYWLVITKFLFDWQVDFISPIMRFAITAQILEEKKRLYMFFANARLWRESTCWVTRVRLRVMLLCVLRFLKMLNSESCAEVARWSPWSSQYFMKYTPYYKNSYVMNFHGKKPVLFVGLILWPLFVYKKPWVY